MNITYWLRKTPRPAALLADDKRIEIPKNARAWKDLTATIASLEPSKITALDGQGNVIRSIVLESDDDDDGKAQPSAEMTDVQFFGRLLAEAYEKGGKSTQPIVDSAMGFIDRQGARLAKQETENERLRAVIHKQSLQIAELSGAAPAGDESLLTTILAGVAQAGALQAPQPPAATNVSAIKPGGVKK